MITAIDKHTALVLIDLQKGIVQMPVVHPINGVLKTSALLAEAFRREGLPVILVTANPTDSPWQRSRKDIGSMRGSTLPAGFTDLVEEIRAQPSDTRVTKHTWGAFYKTSLHDELQKRGVTGIVLGGVATSRGVEGTARGAAELGYNISFATDAMTDTDMEMHTSSLKFIFPRIGELGTSAEIMQKLSNRV